MTQQIQASAKLGKFLQRTYSDGITNQLSEDFRDWSMVDKIKVSEQAARTVDFLINKSYGAPAVKMKNSGAVSLPKGRQSNTAEGSAGFNQIYATVELEYDLWERAKSGAKKYLEPLAHEIQNKGVVQKRILSAQFHLDGSGIYGEVVSAVQGVDANRVVLTLDSSDTARGGERYLELEDEIVLRSSTGTVAAASFNQTVLIVEDKDRDANTITVVGYDLVTDTEVAISAADIAGGEVIARTESDLATSGTASFDPSAAMSSLGEINSLSEDIPGLESLTAKDSRTLHNLQLKGVYKGEHYDAGNAPIDITHLQRSMDRIKTRNGPAFKYRQVLCAPETLSAFIEANEADRRLVSNTDKERGFSGFCYVHESDRLELTSSEFAGDKRMWMIPEGKAAGGCLEFHGKDFTEINVGGSEYLRQDGNGNYQNVVQKFMMGYMTLICKRPGAILKIHNFQN